MAEMHSQARASSPYELVPNILRYTFNNLYIFHCCKNDYFQMKNCDIFLIFAQNIDRGYSLVPTPQ